MAQSGTYKSKATPQTSRQYLLEDGFNTGLVDAQANTQPGAFKSLVNFNIEADGAYLKARPGRVSCAEFNRPLSSSFEDPTVNGLSGYTTEPVDADMNPALTNVIYDAIHTEHSFSKPNELVPLGVFSVNINTTPYNVALTAVKSYIQSHAVYSNLYAFTKIDGVKITQSQIQTQDSKIVEMSTTGGELIPVNNTLPNFIAPHKTVGCTLNNIFYFMGKETTTPPHPPDEPPTTITTYGLFKTDFTITQPTAEQINTGIIRDKLSVEHTYIEAYAPDASEARNYGYNMLLESPYTFSYDEEAPNWAVQGVLPYKNNGTWDENNWTTFLENGKLDLDLKTGSRPRFIVYYDQPDELGAEEQKHVYMRIETQQEGQSDWTVVYKAVRLTNLDDDGVTIITKRYGNNKPFKCDLIVIPKSDYCIRVTIYRFNDDNKEEILFQCPYSFSGGDNNTKSSTKGITPEVHDLTTATGMLPWKQRIILYGVDTAKNYLFMSDIGAPNYFPYPNGAVQYNAPIHHVVAFGESLLVFTENAIYKTTLAPDGYNTITETVAQNISYKASDKYSTVVVKNMVFYKTDNQFNMLVPSTSAVSQGSLAIAPISEPIKNTLNNLKEHITSTIRSVYPDIDWNSMFIGTKFYNTFLDNNKIYINYNIQIGPNTPNVDYDYYNFTYSLQYDTLKRIWTSALYNMGMTYVLPITNELANTTLWLKGRATPNFIRYFADPYILYPDSEQQYFPFFVTDAYYYPDICKIDTTTTQDKLYEMFETIQSKQLVTTQYIDTGYREINSQESKRFREMQLRLITTGGRPLTFTASFMLGNEQRQSNMTRHSSSLAGLPEESPALNSRTFILTESTFAQTNRATIKWHLSGKGKAPRLTILSENTTPFDITGLAWIFRDLNRR